MKQQTLKAIVPAFAIAFIFVSVGYTSCNKCKLENDYTIHFTNDSTLVRRTGSQWMGYTDYQVKDAAISNMRGSFKDDIRIKVVEGRADFLFVIDSIATESSTWNEFVIDPCYESQGWLYQQLNPPDTINYTLSRAGILVHGHLLDTLRATNMPFTFSLLDIQYLEQPYDSTHCTQYEVKGEGYAGTALRDVGTKAARSICNWIRSNIEQN